MSTDQNRRTQIPIMLSVTVLAALCFGGTILWAVTGSERWVWLFLSTFIPLSLIGLYAELRTGRGRNKGRSA